MRPPSSNWTTPDRNLRAQLKPGVIFNNSDSEAVRWTGMRFRAMRPRRNTSGVFQPTVGAVFAFVAVEAI